MAGAPFSKREWEVIDLLLQAKSNKQIAQMLHISESTVEYHLQHIYAKTNVESRAEAIVKLGKTPIPAPKEIQGISTVAGSAGTEHDGENSAQAAHMNQPKPSFQLSIPFLISAGAVLVAILALAVAARSGGRVMPVEVTRVVLVEVTRPVEVVQAVEVTRPVEVTQAVEVTRVVEMIREVEVTRLVSSPVVMAGPAMGVERDWPGTTRLADGRVLVAGGNRADADFLAWVEVYDPISRSITPVAPMNTPRSPGSAAALADGRVLVTGGYNASSGWLADAELYDPARDAWTVTQPLHPHGVQHTATRLADGRVLVIGGATGSGQCSQRAELFDPVSQAWREVDPLPEPRASHTATLLPDGLVLVAGGDDCQAGSMTDALLFDPQDGTWSETGPMVEPVRQHQAALLPGGRVLVAGGLLNRMLPGQVATAIAQVYNPATGAWSAVSPAARARYNFALVALTDGRVVMAGGADEWDNTWDDSNFVREVELYTPTTAGWQVIGELPEPRAELGAAWLPGDRVWLVGGRTATRYWSSTWIVDANNMP